MTGLFSKIWELPHKGKSLLWQGAKASGERDRQGAGRWPLKRWLLSSFPARWAWASAWLCLACVTSAQERRGCFREMGWGPPGREDTHRKAKKDFWEHLTECVSLGWWRRIQSCPCSSADGVKGLMGGAQLLRVQTGFKRETGPHPSTTEDVFFC